MVQLSVQSVAHTATIVLYILLSVISKAQSAAPVAVVGSQYATVNNTLYIQGGSVDLKGTNVTPALYSLDLTKPWNDQSPPWISLATSAGTFSAPPTWQQSMTVTTDRNYLVVWDAVKAIMSIYDIRNKIWSNVVNLPAANPKWSGLKALIDPASAAVGTVYVPDGCYSLTSAPLLCIYNINTEAMTTSTMPSGQMPFNVSYYSFQYSNLRKSMLLYGGITVNSSPVQSSPYLFEFIPSTLQWTVLQAAGTPPGDLNSHCMAQTSDQSKMIIFGGVSVAGAVSGSIFILDLKALSWTKGADVPTAQSRSGHSCATNGDSFIAWGGQSSTAVMDSVPLIYNIPTNQWVHDFVVTGPLPTTAAPTSAPTGTSLPSPTPAAKSSNSGGAIGGAIGGVIIVALLIGNCVYRRRKNGAKLLPSFKTDTGEDSHTEEKETKTRDRILQRTASAAIMDLGDPEKEWNAIYPADSSPNKEEVSRSTPPSLPPPRRPRSSPRPALYTQRSSPGGGRELPAPPGEWDSLGPDHLSKSTLTPDPDGISSEHLRPTALAHEPDKPALPRTRKKRARSRDPNTARSGASPAGIPTSGPDPHRPLSDITDTTGSTFTGTQSSDAGPHRPLSANSDMVSPSLLTPAFTPPLGTSGPMNPQEGTPNLQVRTPVPSNPQIHRPRAPQEYPDHAWEGTIQNHPHDVILPTNEPQYGAWGSETSDPTNDSIRAPQLVPRTLQYRAHPDPLTRLPDNPHKMTSPDGVNSVIGERGGGGGGSGGPTTYFPPPPPTDNNSIVVMEHNLAMMKAQHDFDLEQMRLSQEALRKAAARQAREARKARQARKEEGQDYI